MPITLLLRALTLTLVYWPHLTLNNVVILIQDISINNTFSTSKKDSTWPSNQCFEKDSGMTINHFGFHCHGKKNPQSLSFPLNFNMIEEFIFGKMFMIATLFSHACCCHMTYAYDQALFELTQISDSTCCLGINIQLWGRRIGLPLDGC